MRVKFVISILLGFALGCANGNPRATRPPSHPPQSKNAANKDKAKNYIKKDGPSQSQPAVLRVTTEFTYPNQERLSASLFFYSPAAEKNPESAKMELKEFIKPGSSQPIVRLLVAGESDLEGNSATLKPSDLKTFEATDLHSELKTLFQHFSVRIDSDSSILPDFRPGPDVTLALPLPLFLLNLETSDRHIPEAEDLVQEIVLSKSKLEPIGRGFVLDEESNATFKFKEYACSLETILPVNSQKKPFSFQFKNDEGPIHLTTGLSELQVVEDNAHGDAVIVCKAAIKDIPAKKANYQFWGESRTVIPGGVKVVP